MLLPLPACQVGSSGAVAPAFCFLLESPRSHPRRIRCVLRQGQWRVYELDEAARRSFDELYDRHTESQRQAHLVDLNSRWHSKAKTKHLRHAFVHLCEQTQLGGEGEAWSCRLPVKAPIWSSAQRLHGLRRQESRAVFLQRFWKRLLHRMVTQLLGLGALLAPAKCEFVMPYSRHCVFLPRISNPNSKLIIVIIIITIIIKLLLPCYYCYCYCYDYYYYYFFFCYCYYK